MTRSVLPQKLETEDAPSPLPEWARTYDEGRLLRDKPFRSVCYAPFSTLDFGHTGDVIVCCANTSHIVGNVRTQSIAEIWHGRAISTIRQMLRQYAFAKGCDKCQLQINRGDLRTTYSKRDDVYTLTEWERGPIKMDFRLSNACNLACIMCCGEYSSRIRHDVEHLPPLDCSYPDAFFDELAAFIPTLRYAWFTGGEPFLVQHNYRVWDLLIQQGSHVKCRITTNGTILTEKVRSYLERLNLADLCVSIDGATATTFEKIRVGASFEAVMRHLAYFSDYCRRTSTKLHFAVCGLAENWQELPDIFLLASRFGANVWSNVVTTSARGSTDHPISVLDLPDSQQQKIARYLAARFSDIAPSLDEESRANYQLLLNTLKGPVVVAGVTTGGTGSQW